MSVHDLLFPETLSVGTKGGPGYKTVISSGDSGYEVRATEWDPDRSRLRFDVAKSIQTEDDLAELLAFYLCVRGSGKGFLFRDLSDWTTNTNHRSLANVSDPEHRHPCYPATTDGSNRIYQLRKRYRDSAGREFYRKITRPIKPKYYGSRLGVFVAGVPIYFNGLNVSPFVTAVDWDTGRVHIGGPALPAGLPVEAVVHFHVPSRFGAELDARFEAVWAEADQFELQSVPIVEIAGDRASSHGEHLHGGSTVVGLSSSPPHVLQFGNGFYQKFTGGPSSGGTIWTPTEPIELPGGGPYFLLENQSAGGLVIRGQNGVGLLGSLAVGQACELWKIAIGAALTSWVLR